MLRGTAALPQNWTKINTIAGTIDSKNFNAVAQ
jgi:hypothetical protein